MAEFVLDGISIATPLIKQINVLRDTIVVECRIPILDPVIALLTDYQTGDVVEFRTEDFEGRGIEGMGTIENIRIDEIVGMGAAQRATIVQIVVRLGVR